MRIINKLMLRTLICASLLVSAGCSTVTITKEGTQRISSEPTMEESKSFFFWGLAGEHSIDVNGVCQGKPAQQMQTQTTFLDGLLGGITLGIYAPRSAKVWCAS